jgi:hypothetical protein
VVGSVCKGVSTRRQLSKFSSHHAFVSCVEPKKAYEALEDPDCLIAMHDELNNFKRNKVWTLVERPKDCRDVIGDQVDLQEQARWKWHCHSQQGKIGGSRFLPS